MSLSAVMCRDVYWTALRVKQEPIQNELKKLAEEIYNKKQFATEQVIHYRGRVFHILKKLSLFELNGLRKDVETEESSKVQRENKLDDFIKFVMDAVKAKEVLGKKIYPKQLLKRIIESEDPNRAKIALEYCTNNFSQGRKKVLNNRMASDLMTQLQTRTDEVAIEIKGKVIFTDFGK